MTDNDPTASRRPRGAAPAQLWVLLAAAATTALGSGAAPFTCPDGATCTEWSDGCNNCSEPEGFVVCTEMYCPCYEDNSCVPKCLDVEGCTPTKVKGDPTENVGDLEGKDPAFAGDQCKSMSACVDCIYWGCAWTDGKCMTGCQVAGAVCYTKEYDMTPAEICEAELDVIAEF